MPISIYIKQPHPLAHPSNVNSNIAPKILQIPARIGKPIQIKIITKITPRISIYQKK